LVGQGFMTLSLSLSLVDRGLPACIPFLRGFLTIFFLKRKGFTEIADVAGTTSVVAESQCGSVLAVLLHFLASLETCHRHLPVPIRSRLPILTCTEPVFQKLP